MLAVVVLVVQVRLVAQVVVVKVHLLHPHQSLAHQTQVAVAVLAQTIMRVAILEPQAALAS
jgi:hypothetical protein